VPTKPTIANVVMIEKNNLRKVRFLFERLVRRRPLPARTLRAFSDLRDKSNSI